MHDETLLNRISADPEIFGDKPIVRGMRMSVELILSLLAQGQTVEAILDDYPELEPADVRACLIYAHAAIGDESIDAVRVTSAGGSWSTVAPVAGWRTGCAAGDMRLWRSRPWAAIRAMRRCSAWPPTKGGFSSRSTPTSAH